MANTHRAAKRRPNLAPGVSPGTRAALRSSPIGAKDSVTVSRLRRSVSKHEKNPGSRPGAGIWIFFRRLGQSGLNLRLQIYVLFPDGKHAQSREAAPQSSPGR